jgi:hypothetical protein
MANKILDNYPYNSTLEKKGYFIKLSYLLRVLTYGKQDCISSRKIGIRGKVDLIKQIEKIEGENKNLNAYLAGLFEGDGHI